MCCTTYEANGAEENFRSPQHGLQIPGSLARLIGLSVL